VSNRAAILDSTWKIFLDGVEVPHQGFSVVFGTDTLSRATISLEPDMRLVDIRPQAVVAIFGRNQFPDAAVNYTTSATVPEVDFLENYFLYWEGLVAGFRHEKSYDARAFILDCESMFDVWRRAGAFAFQIGGLRYSHIVSGSTLPLIDPSRNTDTFTLASLGTYFQQDADRSSSFSARILRTLATITAHSAALRLQTVRYSLLHKIAEIPNNIYESLLAPIASNLFSTAQQFISERASAFDVVTHLLGYGFYNSVHVPIPTTVRNSTQVKIAPWAPLDDVYAFTSRFSRNELLLLPHTYFALPPPCNLIFPDIIQSLSVARSFYSEPTRSLLLDVAFSAEQFRLHVAPSTLVTRVREATVNPGTLRSIDVFGILTTQTAPSQQTKSPYANPKAGINGGPASSISLINSLTDAEIEKGIVPNILTVQFETLAAYASSASAALGTAPDTDLSARIALYDNFITQMLNYKHRLAQATRELTVIINGHRYLTPGFTAVVYDKDISYIGYVSNMQLSVNPVGYETTNVTLTHVRPLTLPSASFLKELSVKIAAILLNTKEASPERNIAYEELALQLMTETDIPIPPFFLSQQMSSAQTLDALYQNLLGCQPFYTSDYHNAALNIPIGNTPPMLSAALFYLEGLHTLMNVYDPNKIPIADTNTGRGFFNSISTTSWVARFGDKDALGASTVEWVNRTFSRRAGTNVATYLDQSGLVLEQDISNGAARKQFFVMTPAVSTDGWDDSVLSKLVYEAANRDIPEITGRRLDAADFLKTSVRQQNIRAFSKDHFGAKAFDGT